MKALKSHPQIERPRRMNSQITLSRHTGGLVLALVGLISAALMKGPIQPVSAETVALGWSYTGSLNTPRYFHTATLLPDGKILVAGGWNTSGSDSPLLDSAELYDPATGKWNATGSLNVPRISHTATLLKDGKVLIVGGSPDDYLSFNGAELYNPKDERWSVTGSLNIPRSAHTATLLKNGKVLVVGGLEEYDWWDYGYRPLDTVELYDPDTGVWSFTGNLNTAVESHTATLLQNGKVLVLGEGSPQLYDPDTGKWSSVGILGDNIGRLGHTATLLPDGRVLIVGGEYSEYPNGYGPSPAQLYDPDTGAWISTGDLNETRFHHTATLLPDGKVLVSGGTARRPRQDNRDSGFVSLRSSELFDPNKGTWSLAGSLKTRRSYHTATLLPDGIPLIVGGFSQDQTWSVDALDSVELGNTFVTLPKITMASVAGKKLIVIGENFYPDSVILINGEELKTRNDDQNPGTTLIGKKAGKKIKPGDRLQVRNPDDILSEEFIFTGS
ncbi:MAG TPA: kelch repeat-containing protein [Blastocatellia bacterium]|nr:kelch repeat-containing protein [Blastocatellia bacterium]